MLQEAERIEIKNEFKLNFNKMNFVISREANNA